MLKCDDKAATGYLIQSLFGRQQNEEVRCFKELGFEV